MPTMTRTKRPRSTRSRDAVATSMPPQTTVNGQIHLNEFAERRQRLLKELNGAPAVIFAGEGTAPLIGRWRPEASFLYLTGLENEAGAAVLFDPAADDPRHRIALFLRPLNLELERWDGYREQIGPELKRRTGFDTIFRANVLPARLTSAARRAKRLACLHPFSVYPAPVSPDLAVIRQVAERMPGVVIEDRTQLLPQMRAIKSPAELNLMRSAVDATAAGYRAAMAMIRPGVNENEIAETLEQTYRRHGGTGLAYNSIVGGGLNGTVLHYMSNDSVVQDGDLLVIDSGAEYRGYASDVTRTLPVSGTFTSDQRDAYEVVLDAQVASIKAVRPGMKWFEVDDAARNVIERAGLGHAFIHGVGHQLGMEVHDVTPDGELKPGMVVTIEPGIYLPEQKMGIRIEDDILVTRNGNENLTHMIPKTVKEIEAAMGQIQS
jgi:Xaa-Pro aminopeptidase